MGLITEGAEFLAETQLAEEGLTIVYTRDEDSVQLVALAGRTPVEIATQQGFVERVMTGDWLVRAADLVLDGDAVEPQAGDRIELAAGGEKIWEVRAPTPGAACWSSIGPQATILRIHTKQVA